jgi:hypothetical protein
MADVAPRRGGDYLIGPLKAARGSAMYWLLLAPLALVPACASSSANQPPGTVPSREHGDRPSTLCVDRSQPYRPPVPLNYDAVRRSVGIHWPDQIPQSGPPIVLFLRFFIRENGSTAKVEIWRSSRNPQVDDIALQVGTELRWQPARCGESPIAGWYGHPIALGGAP